MRTTSFASWLFFAVFAVVFVCWYSVRQSALVFDGSMVSASAIDADVSDLTVQQFDINGHEQHSLHSPKVQRIPLKKQHVFQQPHIMITQNNEPSWEISADQAIAKRNGEKMIFNNNVMISRAAEKNTPNNQLIMHADKVVFNRLTNKGVYTGHVTIDQGTTHIQSSKATTQVDTQNKLQQITLNGFKNNQVHYTSIVKNKPDVHAYADVMQYFPKRHMIQFIGNAKLRQGNDFFAAPMIMYDTLSQHMVSSSSGVVRTTIVIHPENYS